MKGYITAVAAAAIMSAFADILIPKSWQKYISILTGAILLITLTSPLIRLRGITIPSLTMPDNSYTEYDLEGEVQATLEDNISSDIEERLKSEFGIDCRASVSLLLDNGKITGIKEIVLYCSENNAVTNRIAEVYGCSSIIYKNR